MKIKTFEDKESWLEARKGKITGSRLKDIVVKRGTGEKITFYEMIAERIAEPADDENPMERGIRLETEAITEFEKVIEQKIDTSLVIWESDENKDIAISPDGFTDRETAVEVKCLSSAKHLEAYLTKKVPSDYEYQVLQYFIVNEELETLYFVMYDPRMPDKIKLHYFTIKREEVQEQVDIYLAYQKEKLAEIDRIVTELTF